MLKYVVTSLFDSPAQTLVNTVNTVGVMGKGIAAEFKRQYPEMFRQYRSFCKSGALKVGKLQLYKTPHKWVLNFPTKEHWRQPSKIEYIEAGLQKFVESHSQQGVTSVSFPQLGTGNGGLNWEDVVRPLMDKYLARLDIPVFVHVANRPMTFVPEHLEKNRNAPRLFIGIADFFDDLREIAHLETSSTEQDDRALPAVRLDSGEVIPGEGFAQLWEELKLQGAIGIDEFPPLLAKHAQVVKELLLRLEYIQSIKFQTDGDGLQFAPTNTTQAPTNVLAERETIAH